MPSPLNIPGAIRPEWQNAVVPLISRYIRLRTLEKRPTPARARFPDPSTRGQMIAPVIVNPFRHASAQFGKSSGGIGLVTRYACAEIVRLFGGSPRTKA